MSDTPIISTADLLTLNTARDILDRIEKDCCTRRWDAAADSYMKPDAFSYGRVAEAADLAETAIFNMLNIVNAHNIQKISDAVMIDRQPQPEPARRVQRDDDHPYDITEPKHPDHHDVMSDLADLA